MALNLVFIGTPAAANVAIAAMQAQPGNVAEAAMLSRLVPVLQAEVTAMGAVNAVNINIAGMHTEKSFYLDVNIDKATPVLGTQLVSLSNLSPAN